MNDSSTLPLAVGAGGTTYTYLGLPLSEWVAIFTITFLLLKIIAILPEVRSTLRKFFGGGDE